MATYIKPEAIKDASLPIGKVAAMSEDERLAFLVSLGLGKIGVVSQVQNWNASNTEYTISNKVMGVIPQSFITEWIDATKAWYDPYGGPNPTEIQEGSFNEQTGYFELHGLTDLTYYDARMIMLYGRRLGINYFSCANSLGVRTIHVPTLGNLWSSVNAMGLFVPPDAEVVKCPIGWTAPQRWLLKKNNYDDLNQQNKLHTIEYVMINSTHVTYLPALRNCKIMINGNGVILNLAKSPLLTIQSVKDMIELSHGSCTLTLHKDVYDAAMADESILAALEAHTNISLASA